MSIYDLLGKKLTIVNVGVEQFSEDLIEQGADVIQVQFNIPAHIDDRIEKLIAKFDELDEEK